MEKILLSLTEQEYHTVWDALNDRAEQLEDQINTDTAVSDEDRAELEESLKELTDLRDRLDAARLAI